MKFDAPKWITTGVWVLIVINLIAPFPGILNGILFWTGVALAVAHIIEYVMFFKVINARPEGPALAFVMTFLYGIFYWKQPAGDSPDD
ncbi:MAG: DUF1145 domain-containing protein [Pseudomonadota bacterium]